MDDELKQLALRMAVSAQPGGSPEHIVKCAQAFEDFLSGKADAQDASEAPVRTPYRRARELAVWLGGWRPGKGLSITEPATVAILLTALDVAYPEERA